MEMMGQDVDIVELMKEAENGDDAAVETLLLASTFIDELSSSNHEFWTLMHGYYKRMAARGNERAFIYLADNYKNGVGGVEKDIRKAKEYYELAIGHGCPAGYEFLAHLYMLGDTLPVNYKKAYRLFMKALSYDENRQALQSDVGCYLLAEIYFRGLYGYQNLKCAEEQYKNVISMGSDFDASYYWRAQYRLGQIYELEGDNESAKKHKDIAREYYNADEAWDEVNVEKLLIDYK
ncbi:tetratricopeptide repeat protein [Butyrivibrio sp. XB500-5]|uniref:tetratricopeptide repeat protein n=1 Tax=Butyrivibrio sp. XB500-5 TaxID=2364880 RepID=UPI001314565A|nr:SEL1-like repeat protein [Butyrivibrio sp. XB500-5]